MRIAFFYILFISVTLYALYRGGAPERSVAAAYFSIWVLGKFTNFFVPAEYAEMDFWIFIVDFALWVGLLAIALRAKRFWPLWVVSLQTIALAGHIAKLMDVSIHPRAYLTMQIASTFPLLIILAIGVYHHQRRLKTNGTDPAWRSA